MSLIVKICGLSTPEALDVALEAGADMVGFVFFRAVAAPSGIRCGAHARPARARPRAKSGAHGRCRRCVARCRRRSPAAGPAAASRQGNAGARRRAQAALRPAGDEGDRRRSERRPRGCRGLCQRRRPTVVRCARAARGDAAGRTRQAVRLAPSGKSRSRRAVHALGRARCRQCRRGVAHHPRAGRRCLLGRRARAGRKRPG